MLEGAQECGNIVGTPKDFGVVYRMSLVTCITLAGVRLASRATLGTAKGMRWMMRQFVVGPPAIHLLS